MSEANRRRRRQSGSAWEDGEWSLCCLTPISPSGWFPSEPEDPVVLQVRLDLTYAEALLAGRLCAGESLGTIAATGGRRISTVRNQLRTPVLPQRPLPKYRTGESWHSPEWIVGVDRQRKGRTARKATCQSGRIGRSWREPSAVAAE